MASDNTLILAVGGIAGICATIWGAFTVWTNTRTQTISVPASRLNQVREEVSDLRLQLAALQTRLTSIEAQLEISRSSERWHIDRNRELTEELRHLRSGRRG